MGEAKRKGKPDPSTVEGLIELARRHAGDLYRDNNDPEHQLLPIWTAYSPTEGLIVVATPFTGDSYEESERTKTRVLAMVEIMFACKGVTAYSFMSEAWVATVDKNLDPAIAKLKPSQRPDRREVVTIVAADRKGTKKQAAYEIERQPNGAPRLGRDPCVEYDSVSGRMVSVLDRIPPGPVPPELKKMMEELLEKMGGRLDA